MTDVTNTRVSRRGLLKGAAAAAGASLGAGAVTGFPTIWAQNIKDVTINHVGQSFSVIPQIAEQAIKDLGFKIDMQTVDYATQMNRMFTQPDTIDISDLSINIVPEGIGLPIPIPKYKYWDKTVPLGHDDGRDLAGDVRARHRHDGRKPRGPTGALRRRARGRHQALRSHRRGGRHLAAYPQGQLLLPAGPERLRQIHDPSHDRRPRAGQRRRRAGGRPQRHRRTAERARHLYDAPEPRA